MEGTHLGFWGVPEDFPKDRCALDRSIESLLSVVLETLEILVPGPASFKEEFGNVHGFHMQHRFKQVSIFRCIQTEGIIGTVPYWKNQVLSD